MTVGRAQWRQSAIPRLAGALALAALALPAYATGPVVTVPATADAFLAKGSPGNPAGADLSKLNFGGTGSLTVASGSSLKGEQVSVLRFDLSAAASQFDATFGVGNWQATGASLRLASAYGTVGAQPGNAIFNATAGGAFEVTWLSKDDWQEGTGNGMGGPGYPATAAVSFQSVPLLLAAPTVALGRFVYEPPGSAAYVEYKLAAAPELLADISAGGDVSLYLNPADDHVAYLFNARSFGSGGPELAVTATQR